MKKQTLRELRLDVKAKRQAAWDRAERRNASEKSKDRAMAEAEYWSAIYAVLWDYEKGVPATA